MFNMNASTVAVTDYAIINPKLARVIISFTGQQDAKSIRTAVAKKFEGLASVVEHSFRKVKDGVAVGFIRANREVRTVDAAELQASYRVMGSNMVMDATDKSLWKVQEGKGGKYLTRHAQEDLTALVASAAHRRSDVPGLRHLAIARAGASELVAFVDAEGSVDYGFAVTNYEDRVKLVSHSTRMPQVVPYDQVVSIHPLQLDLEFKAKVTAAMSAKDKADAIAYWKQLYSFAPEYMREVIRQVEEDTVS